ncbi:MAG: ribonuclease T2 [Alphaproteobacteria bacterium]|nr:ribonuclease T2 [Alphaproteobacteria bacterium]
MMKWMPARLTALSMAFMVMIAGFGDVVHAQRYGGGDSADRGRSDQGDKPGKFDYYTLVLSWSPTHCASQPAAKTRNDPQCSSKPGGRPYAFVLHGLWPQHMKGFPERCWTDFKPYVPKPIITGMLDIMPSTGLIIHQYKKHGTCSGLKPEEYFGLSSRIFRRIKVPERYVLPSKPQMVAPDTLIDEFIAANPVLGLGHDMIAVSCGGAGNRLREVRICVNKDGDPRSCGSNEDQRRLCSANRMYVPPVRVPAGP